MKSDAVFKRAFNDALDLIDNLPPDAVFPSENQLSAQLRVSRTTVRKILAAMKKAGFAPDGARRKSIAGIPRFAEAETITRLRRPDLLERHGGVPVQSPSGARRKDEDVKS